MPSLSTDPRPAAGPRPPLDGLRILAVSQFGAGPFGSTVLADLGAEVIKVEDPSSGGDVSRYVPPYVGDGDSLYFQSLNRGKKSLTLDLKHPEGRAVLHDLVRVSHGVYSNLRGDQPAKLGLTYATLGAVNPAIVCCALSGFGMTGPRAADPALDFLVQGWAGFMSITGSPDGPPDKCGVSVIDFAGGFASVLGLMVGLWDAQRSGIGRDIDIALMDTAVSMLSYMAIWSLNRDWEPTRVAQAGHQTLVPAQNFRTRDGWVVIFCSKEKFWANLAEGIGRPELASDPRFRTFPDRMANKPALLAILEPILRERTTAEWLVRLRGRVPCSPVNSIREALADEQTRARDMIVEVAHPVWGALREVACPIKTAGEIRRPAPAPGLGEHTEPLLRDTLGYSADRVAALRACGAIGPAPR